MGLLDWLGLTNRGHDVDELARRLDMRADELLAFKPKYRKFTIPKRRGGRRTILAPSAETKALQRRILRRLLAKLRTHPAATGFERGKSIVDNARPHVGKSAVVRMDLVDFFPSTSSKRVQQYFHKIGWNRKTAELLTRLTTRSGSLPQGAPTSPRLSNLVNYRIDARIAAYAGSVGAAYTRYADDITLSFAQIETPESWTGRSSKSLKKRSSVASKDNRRIHSVQEFVRIICEENGYRVHKRKGAVRRRHQQQLVTGLVVNERVRLPRVIRRRLRAVLHRSMSQMQSRPLGEGSLGSAKKPTLTPSQLAGWQALMRMVDRG